MAEPSKSGSLYNNGTGFGTSVGVTCTSIAADTQVFVLVAGSFAGSYACSSPNLTFTKVAEAINSASGASNNVTIFSAPNSSIRTNEVVTVTRTGGESDFIVAVQAFSDCPDYTSLVANTDFGRLQVVIDDSEESTALNGNITTQEADSLIFGAYAAYSTATTVVTNTTKALTTTINSEFGVIERSDQPLSAGTYALGVTIDSGANWRGGALAAVEILGVSSGPAYATGSFSSAFSIRNYASNSFNSAYSIRNYIAAAFNSAFSIRNFASGDYTSAFSIKNFVSGDYASAFSIRNFATGGFSSAFSILGVETVSGSFSSAYSIRNYANAAFDSAFSIRNFVSGDYDSAYSIRKLVSGDFDSAYSIRNFATGEYSSAYSIIAYATGSFDSAFSIRNYATGNYSSAFSIAAVVIATGTFDSAFSIRNFISGSYNSSFSINFTEGRLKQAMKEAYASAPAGVIVIHTLEFRHPNFRDNGQPTSIKVVLGHSDLEAKLEDSAPLKPGQYVTFVAMAFDLDLPNIEHLATPEVSISIDNVSREIEDNLMTAAASPYPVEVTYRPYLNTDLTGPQMDPPLTLTLISAEADDFSVKARAIYGNAAQVLVPRETYTADRFPGVQR